MSIYLSPRFSSFHTEDSPRGLQDGDTKKYCQRERERENQSNVFVQQAFLWLPHHIESVIYQTITNRPEHHHQVFILLFFFFFLWTKEVSLLHFLKSILGLWAKQLEVASLSWCKWDSILGPMNNKKRLYQLNQLTSTIFTVIFA